MKWDTILFNSGDLFLPTHVKEFLEQYIIGNNTSVFYVNWWTFIHFVSGMLTGRLLTESTAPVVATTMRYYLIGFAIHTLWEIWQIIGKNTHYWTLRGKVDIVADTAAFMLGMWVLYGLNST